MASKKLGRWLKEPIDGDRDWYYIACSFCGKRAVDIRYRFCPWCGKTMESGKLWLGDTLEEETTAAKD